MILQLNPPMPVICPKGKAVAHFIVDHGIEHDILWVCFLDDSGECWTYNNKMIRAQKNETMGREYISPFYDPDDVAFKKKDVKLISCLSCGSERFRDEIVQDFIPINGKPVRFTYEACVCLECGETFCTTEQMDVLLKMYGERVKDGMDKY